jgi:hypothetical protein
VFELSSKENKIPVNLQKNNLFAYVGGTQFVGLWGFMKNACCADAAGI